jgi:inorganic triphosphatase YgiF
MTTTVGETERQYEISDAAELPGLAGLASNRSPVGPEVQTLEAVYFDTDDLCLAQAGVTLRRRRGGATRAGISRCRQVGTAAARSG